jgi:hypothetical protein
VTHHLEPVPDEWPREPDDAPFGISREDDADDLQPVARPAWWRWIAIAVIVAMVVAGPLAVALRRLLT